MFDLIRHHIPSLKQSKTKYVWTAKTCPFCNPKTKSNSFRVNTKLRVFKCFQCGRGGRSTNSFVKQLKTSKIKGYYFYPQYGRFKRLTKVRMTPFEIYYGCSTYQDTLLPF